MSNYIPQKIDVIAYRSRIDHVMLLTPTDPLLLYIAHEDGLLKLNAYSVSFHIALYLAEITAMPKSFFPKRTDGFWLEQNSFNTWFTCDIAKLAWCQCCRDARHLSKRLKISKPESHGFGIWQTSYHSVAEALCYGRMASLTCCYCVMCFIPSFSYIAPQNHKFIPIGVVTAQWNLQ